MKYKYKCTRPMLPPDAESPVMDYRQMEAWLDEMDGEGWEFVGYGQKQLKRHGDVFVQDWWIFRKPVGNRR